MLKLRVHLVGLLLCAVAAVIGGAGTARAEDELPLAYTLLGPAGVVARVITDQDTCPMLTVDGQPLAMAVRAQPSDAFPVLVCDATVPAAAQVLSLEGNRLPLPVMEPARISIVGDTGCRIKGSKVQACNDPAQWPWAQLAASAAGSNPELVIHVGDYVYRETACPDGDEGCAGSPYGDNWETWWVDMMAPARPLLEAAPWVVVRGNHEDCARMGNGYFLLMDPRPLPASCPDYSDVYTIDSMSPQLLIMDNSAADDYNIDADQLAAYGPQLEQIDAAAKEGAWFLLHDPMYVFGHLGEQDGKEQLFIDQLMLQQASNNQFSPAISLFLSGHVHLLQILSFGEERPAQLVVGHSGTQLDSPVTTPLAGQEIGGMPVAFGVSDSSFGYVTATRAAGGWDMIPRNVAGAATGACTLRSRELNCEGLKGDAVAAPEVATSAATPTPAATPEVDAAATPAALPTTGGEPGGWAAVAMAMLMLLGLAVTDKLSHARVHQSRERE
ncbi:MAG: metallophosphoesterase [Anaerolineales bacterium]|nr:metallophosphoesterase [Anaerolineales bacterium]